MTAAAYSTNLSDIYAGAGSTSGWTAIGGGASGLNAETDFFIQGTGCTSKNAFASATKGMILDGGSDQSYGGDGAYLMWLTHLTPNSLDNIAGGGLQMLVGSNNGDYEQYYVGGSDTIEFGGWILAAVSEGISGDATTGTPHATIERFFGALFDLPSGGPTKGAPNAIDAIRAGRCDIVIEHGTGADPEADFDGVITNLETATNRYGLLIFKEGAFYNSGLVQFGSATNAVEFLDSNKTIFLRDHPHVVTNFHTWEVKNASSVITLTNMVVKALGTASKGRWITTDNATVVLTGCSFIDMATFAFLSNTTVDTCTFLSCDQITHGGSVMNSSSILTSAVAAGSGAVLYNESADPDGKMDNMVFSQGAATHSAIEFGTSVTADITLRGIDFTGFGSTDDVNGAVFKFLATTGSLNLNLVGCTTDGTFSVDDTAGIDVTVVIDPVTEAVNVKDVEGTNRQNVRVFVETAATIASGEMFEASVTSLTSSAGTATCTTTAVHGLVTGDKVVIRGAQPDDYNKVATVTVSSTTVFTYSVTSGISSPATGTPVISFVALHGLTDINGDVSSSRTWGAAQSMKGWARKKNTVSPFFKDGNIAYNIDTTNGNTVNVVLQPDE